MLSKSMSQQNQNLGTEQDESGSSRFNVKSYAHFQIDYLTHLPLDKMATILQIFLNAFSWMKKF